MRNLLILLFISSSIQPALAQSSSASHLPESRVKYFNQLNSSIVEVIDESNPYFDEELGDYPFLARIVQKDIFKWDPRGKPRRFPDECNAFIWQRDSLTQRIPADLWPIELERYLKSCEGQWKTWWTDVFSNSLGMMSFKLHPNRHPYGRHVILNLPNKVKVKGLLAMKTDGKKRPFVIFRTGLFSNTQEFYPERFLFFQMFEQSPFNMLVLESSSGSEFLKHNDSYSLGGFDEGLQNFWIAQALQKEAEPISRFIESVHMMGLSMGGHGAMFSALLNQLNPGPSREPVVQSVLAFCPLLNMQETLDYHRSQGFTMDLMNYWASRRLKIVKEKVPGLRDDNFIPDYFDWIRQNYKGPLIAVDGKVPGVHLPSEVESILAAGGSSQDLFWKLNHFWTWFQKVETPTLIFSTRRDPIVSWFINTGRLDDGRLNLKDSNIRAFTFEEGFHCSLPISYDWAALTSVFQTHFLKMSPGYQQEVREHRVPLTAKILKAFDGRRAYLDLRFNVYQQTGDLFTTVRFDSRFDPSYWEQFWAPEMTAHLPLSEMEFPIDKVVRSDDEASLLRRWAYQNISARIDGSDLVFSWRVTK